VVCAIKPWSISSVCKNVKGQHPLKAEMYASTWFERLRKETRGVWTCAIQIKVYDALRVGQYVDQSSSHGLEKFGEDILTSPEVIRAQTLHFKPNFKFSPLFFLGGGTPVPVVVCAIKPWSISIACKNLKGQHPLRAEM